MGSHNRVENPEFSHKIKNLRLAFNYLIHYLKQFFIN